MQSYELELVADNKLAEIKGCAYLLTSPLLFYDITQMMEGYFTNAVHVQIESQDIRTGERLYGQVAIKPFHPD